MEWDAREGESPVGFSPFSPRGAVAESGCLGMQPKAGGKFLLRLNTGERPIANKYREGKMKSNVEKGVKKYVKPLKGKRLELAVSVP